MTPGPMDLQYVQGGPRGSPWALGGLRWLQGAQQRAHGFERGPIEMTLKNQHVKLEDFFWKSLVFGRKIPSNFGEDLFFGDHIIFRTKLRHFFRPF